LKVLELEAYRLLPGDVLLSEASGSPGEVGKPAIWRGEIEDCCFQNTVIRFRPKAMPPEFPFVVFCHFARNGIFSRAGKGVGIHHLSADRFSTLAMPLAPLNEQRRIVDKIEELFSDLDAGFAALKRIKANLKRYRAAVLKAAVEGRLTEAWRAKHSKTEPATKLLERILAERRKKWEEDQLAKFAVADKTPPKGWREKYVGPASPDASKMPELPKGWCWVRINQLLHRIEGGKSFKCLTRRATSEEWGVIKVSAMTWGEFLEDEQKAIPPEAAFDPRDEIKPNDLLLSRCNTSELVGATVLVGDCRSRLLLSDKSLRLLVSESLNLRWLHMALSSSVARRQFSAMAPETSDSMRNVSQEKIESVLIPLPSLEEQAQIVEEIEFRLSVIDQAEQQVATNYKRAARLRQSILKRAFAGKLVPQDPADEPADKLLQRIRQERTATNGSVVARTRRGRASTRQPEDETQGAAS